MPRKGSPPVAVDPERVRKFEEDHNDPPVKDAVQMDWPLAFSSPWNSEAINVLSKGFIEDVLDKASFDFHPSETSLRNIRALVTSKLMRTRRAYNDAEQRDQMDTGEDDDRSSAKSAANRQHMRRLGVRVPVIVQCTS